jgi:hypothetical protein
MEDALGHDAFICAQDGRREYRDTVSERPSILSLLVFHRLSPIAFLSSLDHRRTATADKSHSFLPHCLLPFLSLLHFPPVSLLTFFFTFFLYVGHGRRVYLLLDDTASFLLTTGLDYSVGLMYLSSLLARRGWHRVNRLLCVLLSLFSLACVLVISSPRHSRLWNCCPQRVSRFSFSSLFFSSSPLARHLCLWNCCPQRAFRLLSLVSHLSSPHSLCPHTVPTSFLVTHILDDASLS